MKNYVYPVILFANTEDKSYNVLFPDLDIIANGDTVEEAYLIAKDYLQAYVKFAVKMGTKLPEATSYLDAEKMNPKRIILLADVEVEDGQVLTGKEEEYKNFVQRYLYTSED